jgi:hypothetical protein
MNAHVPSMSIWLILAVICWGLAALHGSFFYNAPTGQPYRWGFGGGVGWLGMFFFGLYMIFH